MTRTVLAGLGHYNEWPQLSRQACVIPRIRAEEYDERKAKTRPPMSGPVQAVAALLGACNVLLNLALLRSLIHVCVVCSLKFFMY